MPDGADDLTDAMLHAKQLHDDDLCGYGCAWCVQEEHEAGECEDGCPLCEENADEED